MTLTFALRLSKLSVQEKAACFVSFLETLVRLNLTHLTADPSLPLLAESGVRYLQDPTWKDLLVVLQGRLGDCKDLVAWRLAELREQGIDARAHVVFYKLDGLELFHLQVKTPKGIEDPSLACGMPPLPGVVGLSPGEKREVLRSLV